MKSKSIGIAILIAMSILACKKETQTNQSGITSNQIAILAKFGGRIDFNNLSNYADQELPGYIVKDNSGGNSITNEGATLGRVLFYDKKLSVSNTIACGSCHKQEFAFSDGDLASTGVNGTTDRHAMRLVNARFAEELKFFWDERANTLEEQTTMPIQNHTEMGYSGTDGNEGIGDLLVKLSNEEYYKELFALTFGDEGITEERMQIAIAQFIRSIQSFDSKYDIGVASAANINAPFANFTTQENQGKALFTAPPQFDASGLRIGGGLGCQGCHRAPEFDIAPNSRNNGVVEDITGTGTDFDVVRAPSLRDVFNTSGELNGPLMHTGDFMTMLEVLEHYNEIDPAGNPKLDVKLNPNGTGINLAMTDQEKNAVTSFLKTLSGSDVYTNDMWSDPFED